MEVMVAADEAQPTAMSVRRRASSVGVQTASQLVGALTV